MRVLPKLWREYEQPHEWASDEPQDVRVLIVEDMPPIIENLRATLEQAPWSAFAQLPR
jgi:hypothetical protein